MATVQNIIDHAARLLTVLGGNATLVSDDYAKNLDAFALLQNLMSEWAEDGLIAIPAPSATTDTLTLPEGSVRGLSYNLAVEIAPVFGKTPNPTVIAISETTRDRLESQVDIDVQVDMGDLAFASGGRYNINTDA